MSVECIDSDLSKSEALDGSGIQEPKMRAFHEEMKRYLDVMPVKTKGFDGATHRGQLVAHYLLIDSLVDVFHGLYEIGFPIEKVVPVGNEDGWLDEVAMRANKTSVYAPRVIPGSGILSEHARGLAIDINPWQNPCIHPDGTVEPEGAEYHPNAKNGVISLQTTMGQEVLALFNEKGYEWGGFWPVPLDQLPKEYQHHSAQPHLPNVVADYQHFQLNDTNRETAFPLPAGYA